jgi:catechol 2,3-dioxygenase-like lactoylglutathione lyase family enzyme
MNGGASMLSECRCHATLPVSDLPAARAFYEGVLGFKPYQPNDAAVMYEAGEGSKFAVTTSSGKSAGTHTQIGFTMTDIDAEVADLKRRGVAFEEYDFPGFNTEGGIATTGAGKAAWFLDPAGNMIGLIQFD